MEGFGIVKELLFFFQTLGPWGIVGFLWWDGRKDFQRFKEILAVENKIREQEREKEAKERVEENKKWEEKFTEMKKMYEGNIELVKDYHKLSNDMQSIVILNTQAVTKLTTIIETRGVYES